MTLFKQLRFFLVVIALGFLQATLAETSSQTETPRPEISARLVEAKGFFDAKNYPDALAKIAQTDTVSDKTAYEVYVIESTRGNYLLASGDKTNAVKAFESAIGSHYLNSADQLKMVRAIGQLYFELPDYPKAIVWTEKYLNEGGTDPKAKRVLYQAAYLNKDYPAALKGVSAQIDEDIAAGRTPSEQDFKLLVSCKAQTNDKVGSLKAIEQMNSFYPTAKNWQYLLGQVHLKPGFSERMYLDVYRLKSELALMNSAADYVDMADLATRAGFPAEAKKALEKGIAKGLLDKEKYASLKNTADNRAAEDLKTMQQGEASANKSKDGAGLVNLGLAYATAGQFAKGIELIQQGITKGGLTRLEEAKLHLGIVYFWAGKKEEAIKQLSTVHGIDGTAELAKLWTMQISRPL